MHLTSDSGVTGLGAIRVVRATPGRGGQTSIGPQARGSRLLSSIASTWLWQPLDARGASDECPTGMCRVTIREVAAEGRVSLGTVSNVLDAAD